MAHYLILRSVHEGYKAKQNDVGYWNFIHIPAERKTWPDGIMIVAKNQHDALETYKLCQEQG